MSNELEHLRIEGNGRLKNGDAKGAVELYTRGLQIDPNNPLLLSNRAAAYAKLEEWELSYADAKHAASENESMWKAWSRCGFASLFLRKPLRAVDHYRRAVAEFRKTTRGPLGHALEEGTKRAMEGANEFLSSGRNAELVEGPADKNEGALWLQLVDSYSIKLRCLGCLHSDLSINDRLRTRLPADSLSKLPSILEP